MRKETIILLGLLAIFGLVIFSLTKKKQQKQEEKKEDKEKKEEEKKKIEQKPDVVITVRNKTFSIGFFEQIDINCNKYKPIDYKLLYTEKGIGNEMVYAYKVLVEGMKPVFITFYTDGKVDSIYPRQAPVCQNTYQITANFIPYSFIIY